MEEEEYVLSLDSYSKEIETKIDIIISLRAKIHSIETIDHFIKDKTQIIQSLFETEDLLRNSCLFLRKNYFKHKKSLLMGTICKEYECNFLDSFPVFSTINPTENKVNKNGFSECGTIDIQQPIALKDKDDSVFKEDMTQKNDSFLNNCQQETISYQLSTDKDNHLAILTENIKDKEDKSPFKDNNAPDKTNNYNMNCNNDYGHELDLIKKNSNDSLDYLSYMKIKMNLNKEPLKLECNYYDEKEQGMAGDKESQVNTLFYSDRNRKEKIKETEEANKALIKQIQIRELKQKDTDYNFNKDKCLSSIRKSNHNNNHNSIKGSLNKQDASKIADIIMKLNSNKDLYQMILILFNKSIINQLMETPINQTLIDSVEKSINEIKILQLKDKPKDNTNRHIIQKPLYNNNFSSRTKIYQKHSRELNTKKNSNSCSIIENKCEDTIHFNKSLNNSTNKKSSFADELLLNNGFISKRKLISNNTNANSKSKVNSYQLRCTKPFSSISSEHYDSSSPTPQNKKMKKGRNVNSLVKTNKLIKKDGHNNKSAVKQYIKSSLKTKYLATNKQIKNTISNII